MQNRPVPNGNRMTHRPDPPAFVGEWYSICSMHFQYEESCGNCNAGRWISKQEQELSNWLWKYSKRIWRKWANRNGSESRKFLESVFPKLAAKAEPVGLNAEQLEKVHEIIEQHSTDVVDYGGAADDVNDYLFGGMQYGGVLSERDR